MRSALLGLVMCLVPFAAMGEEVWRVAFSQSPPLSWTDEEGNPKGYGIELIRSLAALNGVRAEFRMHPNPGAVIDALRRGQADMSPALRETPARREIAVFTPPHHDLAVSLYALWREADRVARGWPGTVVTGVTGGSHTETVAQRIPGITVRSFGSPLETTAALLSGEVDAVVMPDATLDLLRNRLDTRTRFQKVGQHLEIVPFSIAVARTNPALAERVATSLAAYRLTPGFRALRDRTLGPEPKVWTTRDVQLLSAGAAATVALLAGAWVLSHRQRVQAALLRAAEEKADLVARHSAVLGSRNALLEQRQRELQDFVYLVSHDLASPLVSISGFVSGAARAAEAGDTNTARALLSRITSNVEDMSAMIDRILEVGRTGHDAPKLRQACLPDILRQVETRLSGALEAVGARLSVDADVSLRTDPDLLGQVLQNLIENAARHGCPVPGAEIRVSADCSEAACRISVSDDGPGLPHALRGGTVTAHRNLPRTAGAGLGLAIAARIADQLGASLSADCPPDGGTTFRITFALNTSDTPGETSPPSRAGGPCAPPEIAHIRAVDATA